MSRPPRPELPSDPDPDETDAVRKQRAEKDKQKRKRRPGEREDEAEDTPTLESADTGSQEPAEDAALPEVDDPESVARTAEAERAFRKRVTLRELCGRLPEETYGALERILAADTLDWHLERGRYLLKYLVGERTEPVADHPVRVEQRLAISRETPPVEPARIDRLVRAVLRPDQPAGDIVTELQPVADKLVPGDEVRITVSPDRPETEIVITAEGAIATDRPSPSAEERPVAGPAESAVVEPAHEQPTGAPDPPEVSPDRIERLIEEFWPKPIEVVAEEPAGPVLETGEDVTRPPLETDGIAGVLETLDREAVRINELPPIRGAAEGPEDDAPEPAEPEEPVAEEPRPDRPAEPPRDETAPGPDPLAPAPDREPSRPRRTGRLPDVLTWEPGWAEPVRMPDYGMRKSARKLARRLATEYGLKLTPDLEAYLVALLLQPRIINGRKVYSPGLNVESLIKVISVLKYQFNFTRRPRP